MVTFVVQQQSGSVMTVGEMPLGARAGNALISGCRYLGKLFWPTDLAVFYPRPGHWPAVWVLLAGLLLAGLTGLCWWQRRRHPFLLTGWLWYAGTLVPVIGLVQVGEQAMADRYTYIPSLGVLIMVVWGAEELVRNWRHQKMVWAAVGVAAAVVCVVLTRQQLGYWQDSETLFRHTLTVTTDNFVAHNALGAALDGKDRTDEAIGQFREALRIKPDYAIAHNNLGHALTKKNDNDGAIHEYQEAIRLKPDFADAHYNLGNALVNAGQTGAAVSEFETALRLQPEDAESHNNLGNALLTLG